MKKSDCIKLYMAADEAVELLKEANFCLKNGDCERAEIAAKKLADIGYKSHASKIYMRTGRIEEAREIITPLAEENLRKGEYLFAAIKYKNVGLMEEHRSAMEKHKLVYEMRKNAPFN